MATIFEMRYLILFIDLSLNILSVCLDLEVTHDESEADQVHGEGEVVRGQGVDPEGEEDVGKKIY